MYTNNNERGTAQTPQQRAESENEMKHAVRTYNLSGKFMYESHHTTAEDAYKEYTEIIENMRKTLPSGYGVTVVRFNDGKPMTKETIIGTK